FNKNNSGLYIDQKALNRLLDIKRIEKWNKASNESSKVINSADSSNGPLGNKNKHKEHEPRSTKEQGLGFFEGSKSASKRRIDSDSNTGISAPKEKRDGSTIEKVCHIHMHSIEYLCPVKAYLEYKKRIAVTHCIEKHPIIGNIKIEYLIRNLLKHDVKIGSQRINKHINALMDLIKLDNGKKKPEACAAGTILPTKAGATYENVDTRGFWLSRRIFETYYQISRRSRDNMTNLIHGNSS
ncbi:hypothetical protein BB560_004740, partial [Smittium megazygosporum]